MTPGEVISSAIQSIRPPKLISPAEAAQRIVRLSNPGGYSGPLDLSETPYMIEPLNMLAKRECSGVIFVGPARCGKTQVLIDGWLAYIVLHCPADFMLVQSNAVKARDYMLQRINRMIRASPELRSISPDPDKKIINNSIFQKSFYTGATLRIAWPSVSQLSGSDYRFVALTELDRMPENVGGEGAPFALARKRTQTFLSGAKVLAECSPGKDLLDAKWRPKSQHDSPPVSGIVGLYGGTDRRRWYWPCLHCGASFQATPDLSLFADLPNEEVLRKLIVDGNLDELARQYAHIYCPHCHTKIEETEKRTMNANGYWQPEREGASLSGYWLGGVAASFQPWEQLIQRYFFALREFELTGSEGSLRATVNLDQGSVYVPISAKHAGATVDLINKCEHWKRQTIPDTVTPFIIVMAVDVQANRFVYQAHAISIGCEMWVIDRGEIDIYENRPIDPTSYPEHWDYMVRHLLSIQYKQNTAIYYPNILICDSGGASGTTEQAYLAYKRHPELRKRFRLLKGASNKAGNLFRESRITRNQRDVIPLILINTDAAKDLVEGGLIRESGANAIHFPDWLPEKVIAEFTSETKTTKGWKNFGRQRNEGLDLLVYARTIASYLGADKPTFWQSLPTWINPLIEPVKNKTKPRKPSSGYLTNS